MGALKEIGKGILYVGGTILALAAIGLASILTSDDEEEGEDEEEG